MDLNAAIADGYVELYVCTEQPGVGTMGQHYANLSIVEAGLTVLGQPMNLVEAGNRYGLDPCFAKHAWIWQGNPLGLFADWNPSITVRARRTSRRSARRRSARTHALRGRST